MKGRTKEIREALSDAEMDWVIKHRDGTWTVKKLTAYGFRFRRDVEKLGDEVVMDLAKIGIVAEIVYEEEHRNPRPVDSWWEVRIKVKEK